MFRALPLFYVCVHIRSNFLSQFHHPLNEGLNYKRHSSAVINSTDFRPQRIELKSQLCYFYMASYLVTQSSFYLFIFSFIIMVILPTKYLWQAFRVVIWEFKKLLLFRGNESLPAGWFREDTHHVDNYWQWIGLMPDRHLLWASLNTDRNLSEIGM